MPPLFFGGACSRLEFRNVHIDSSLLASLENCRELSIQLLHVDYVPIGMRCAKKHLRRGKLVSGVIDENSKNTDN